jgi:hypothetical protein
MEKRLLILMLPLLLLSCQKVLHWDLASTGFLVKDNSGNCLPVSISGNYVADSIIGNDNFITVDVNVTDIGTYKIFTDSVNGYSFEATGNFNNTGTNHVKLSCKGRPVSAGTDHFAIHYDTSICQASVVVNSNAVAAAIFSLQGAPAKCMDDTVVGNYVKGTGLDTSDKVNIQVNVTTAGRYDISTNVVNGYSFSATGIFSATGVQTVTMDAKGMPVKDGTDVFNVTGNTSTCNFEVKVISDAAAFTLHGTPGKCIDDSVIGTYVKGIFLDTSSKVDITVDVTLAGRYAIATNVVNGYAFKAFGIFAATGVQTVTMYSDGTPLNAGIDVFTVTGGTTTCTFEVNVLGAFVTVSNSDLFPLSDSSYWTYDDLFNKGTTIQRSMEGTSSANGKVYGVMKEADSYGITRQYLFRKDTAKYLEYTGEDAYTSAFSYTTRVFTDLLFLEEYVQAGTYWESPEFNDVTTFNQVLYLKYGYSCQKAGTVVTVNGKAFADVWIIEMRPQVHAINNPWGSTNEIYTYYYARGVGLIYYKAISNFGFKKAEWQLKSWLVK